MADDGVQGLDRWQAWDETRERVAAVVADAPAGTLTTATGPDGRTADEIVGHLASVARRAAGAPGDVEMDDDLRGVPAPAALDVWASAAAAARARFAEDPAAADAVVVDAVMGEHDLRTALDAPDRSPTSALLIALDVLAGEFSARVSHAGLPALRVTVEQWGTVAGTGNASLCVVADRFDFVRAMAGRRSAAQIRRWNWGDQADPFLPVISPTGPAPADVRERDPRIPAHMQHRDL